MIFLRTRAEVEREIQVNWQDILNKAGTLWCELPKSLSILGSGTKTEKGEAKGVLTAVAYMSPADEAFPEGDGRSMCSHWSEPCRFVCLGREAGRLVMSTSKNARLWKTALYMGARGLWRELLDHEIVALDKRATRLGMIAAVRVDGSSDTTEGRQAARRHPSVQFYDYTKNWLKYHTWQNEGPANYHLTFSYSGKNWGECEDVLKSGGSVAAGYLAKDPWWLDKSESGPKGWNTLYKKFTYLREYFTGYQIPGIDGDEHDARFLDRAPLPGQGFLVFLKMKGRMANTDSARAFCLGE